MMLPSLNSEQMEIFRAVVNANDSNHRECFSVYWSGVTWKTYLWKVIVAMLKSKGKIILLLAPSGIVSLLLPFGRTARAMFKIPVNFIEQHIAHS